MPTVAAVLYAGGAGTVLAWSVRADPLGLGWLGVLTVIGGLTWWRRDPTPAAAAVPAHDLPSEPPL